MSQYGSNADLMSLFAQLGLMDGKGLTRTGKGLSDAKSMMALLMSPQFAALTDTYAGGQQSNVGYVPSEDVAMPTAYDYLNSEGPMATIVKGIMSTDPKERLSPDGAQRELMSQINDKNSALYGQDAAFLTGQLNKVYNEVNNYRQLKAKADYQAAQPNQNDPFVKAGLPSPSERWTGDSAPSNIKQSEIDARKYDQMKIDDLAKMYGMKRGADGLWDTSSNFWNVERQPHSGEVGVALDEDAINALTKSGAGLPMMTNTLLQAAFKEASKGKNTKAMVGKEADALKQAVLDYVHRSTGWGKAAQLSDQQMNNLFKTTLGDSVGASDWADPQKQAQAQKIAGMQERAAVNAAFDQGRRDAHARFLNQSGQTPTMMGLAQRAAMMRQFGI